MRTVETTSTDTSQNFLLQIIQNHRPDLLLSVSIDQPLDHHEVVMRLRGPLPGPETLLRWTAGPAQDIEPMIVDAAWQLGAMDLRRLIFGPLAKVNEFMGPGQGITNAFSGTPYHLPGKDDVTCMADVEKQIKRKTFDETDNTDLCSRAARRGRVSWTFKPMAGNRAHPLFNHWLAQVPDVDDDGCRRGPSRIKRLPFDIPAAGQCTEALYRFVGQKGGRS